jgi:hypothetical protein
MANTNQRESLDLTRKLNRLREIYSEDYISPEQLIYARERVLNLPNDYLKTLTAFCNVYKIKILEREKLPETAKKQFDQDSKDFQTPIALAQGRDLAMYIVDFQKEATEWQSP